MNRKYIYDLFGGGGGGGSSSSRRSSGKKSVNVVSLDHLCFVFQWLLPQPSNGPTSIDTFKPDIIRLVSWGISSNYRSTRSSAIISPRA